MPAHCSQPKALNQRQLRGPRGLGTGPRGPNFRVKRPHRVCRRDPTSRSIGALGWSRSMPELHRSWRTNLNTKPLHFWGRDQCHPRAGTGGGGKVQSKVCHGTPLDRTQRALTHRGASVVPRGSQSSHRCTAGSGGWSPQISTPHDSIYEAVAPAGDRRSVLRWSSLESSGLSPRGELRSAHSPSNNRAGNASPHCSR